MDYEQKYKEALKNFVDIQGYEGLYKVNNRGDILSVRSRKILKAGKNKQGYMCVVLAKDGKCKTYKVHRLVAIAFIPNPRNYPYINHKDENKTNNNVDNLEWCTHKYNINYGTAIERRSKAIKESPIKQRKAVLQLSLHGNIIAEYRSTKEAAEETGIDRRQISRAINHIGKQAQGYLWILKDNYDSNTNYYEMYRKESMHPKPKKIVQYTKDGFQCDTFNQAKNDLFFADEEDELTEFEKEVKDLMNSCCNEIGEADITNEWAKEAAANLLDLTRKELGLVDNTCGEYALNEAYKQGKQDALKDLPKLEKTKDVIDPTIPVMYTYAATNKTYVEYDGHKLCINDAFEKLPKEE